MAVFRRTYGSRRYNQLSIHTSNAQVDIQSDSVGVGNRKLRGDGTVLNAITISSKALCHRYGGSFASVVVVGNSDSQKVAISFGEASIEANMDTLADSLRISGSNSFSDVRSMTHGRPVVAFIGTGNAINEMVSEGISTKITALIAFVHFNSESISDSNTIMLSGGSFEVIGMVDAYGVYKAVNASSLQSVVQTDGESYVFGWRKPIKPSDLDWNELKEGSDSWENSGQNEIWVELIPGSKDWRGKNA